MDYTEHVQPALGRPAKTVGVLGTWFWVTGFHDSREKLTVVVRLKCLGSILIRDYSTAVQMNTCLPKALVAYTRLGVLLKLKCRVYCATVRSLLFHGCGDIKPCAGQQLIW